MPNKSQWIEAVESVARDFAIEGATLELMSPQFTLGKWRIGIEHQRNFESIILKWCGEPENVPEPEVKWIICPDSDKEKGWCYRVKLKPDQLRYFLAGLAPRIDLVDQFSLQEMETEETKRRQVTGTAFCRSADVRRQALKRALGHCEYCNDEGFSTANDEIYLETHHIIPLSSDGPDNISNVAALCPNHHREAHHGKNRKKIQEYLMSKFSGR